MTIVEEDTADAEDDTSNETNCHESIPYQFKDILWDLHYHPNPLLTDNWRKRPRIEFAHDHSDHKTHKTMSFKACACTSRASHSSQRQG